MAAKQRLDPTYEPADAFIGIATNMSATQLVHFINSSTLLNLVREDDLPFYNEKSQKLSPFKFFYYRSVSDRRRHKIYSR